MTLTTFLRRLKAHGPWTLDDGAIVKEHERTTCPWLAVNPSRLPIMDHQRRVTPHAIFRAADGEGGEPRLRARLLRACGLVER